MDPRTRRIVWIVALVAVLGLVAFVVQRWAFAGGDGGGPAAADDEADGATSPGSPGGPSDWGDPVGSGGGRRPDAGSGRRVPGATPDAPTLPPLGTGALAGVVYDLAGRPAVGAVVEVRLDEEDVPWGGGMRAMFERPAAPLAAVRVDYDGFFRIDPVPAGRLAVEAGGGGYIPAVQRGVVVAADAEAWVEFRLESGLAISGKVTDERGAPVANADVSAFARGRTARWATTAGDGSYEIDGLHPGTYDVRADAVGFVPEDRDDVHAGTTGVDFRLGQAGVITGRVVWRGSGSPVGGAAVQASRARGGFGRGRRPGPGFGGRGTTTRTDDDGRFVFDDLDPGDWVVSADAPERAPASSRQVTLAAGGRVDGIVIELGEGSRVSGTVRTDPDLRPVEGAVVRVEDGGGPGGAMHRRFRSIFGHGPTSDDEEDPDRSAVTDAAGRFELAYVAPGQRVLVASHADRPEGRATVSVPEEGDVTGVDLRLPAGGAIAGSVEDSRPTARQMRTLVIAMGGPGGMGPAGSAEVDATGRYRIDGLEAGRYQAMVFRLPGGAETGVPAGPEMSAPKETTVRTGETSIVDFVLGGGTNVQGFVRQGGAEIPGASVSFTPADGPFGGHKSTVADDNGWYRIEGIEPGSYVARVDRTPLPVDIPDVEEHDLDLELPAGAISGRAVDAVTGTPVADARVLVLHAGVGDATPGAPWSSSAYAGSGHTGPDGAFEITALGAGAYEVQVSHAEYSPATVAAEVPTGGRHDGLVVQLEPGAKIAGRVVEAEGAAVAGAFILVSQADGTAVVAGGFHGRMSGADGRFEITGLAPGRYSLRAVASGWAPSAAQTADTAGGEVVLRLTPGGRVEATVLDDADQPVVGASVEIVDAAGASGAVPSMPFGRGGRPPVTDGAGRIVFEHVAPGAWVLHAPAEDGPGASVPVEVREGETTTATIVVAR